MFKVLFNIKSFTRFGNPKDAIPKIEVEIKHLNKAKKAINLLKTKENLSEKQAEKLTKFIDDHLESINNFHKGLLAS